MTLIILAAGLGSRFGGDKQISRVGPSGQMLMEYAAYDAVRAGFDHIVFVLKEDMIETVRRSLGDRIAKAARVSYATQNYASLPTWYTVPAGRTKPFGTVHALLCAVEELDPEDCFATVNADDYYGPEAYQRMAQLLRSLPDRGEAGMVTYRLGNTLSRNGGVTRGLCRTEGGYLQSIRETRNITADSGGTPIADGEILDPEIPVSMNFWGYRANYLPRIRTYFHDFLRGLSPNEQKAECLLPVMAGDLLQAGELSLRVDTTLSHWFGMTYREDRQEVSDKLAALHTAGAYPQTLF
jgi:NDP-sugar pyrophosphorylase family protein